MEYFLSLSWTLLLTSIDFSLASSDNQISVKVVVVG